MTDFAQLSKVWSASAWNALHARTFTWLGRRIEQLPEDMFRIGEIIWQLKPDVIVEVGVQDGGALLFYAMLQSVWSGWTIGVDMKEPDEFLLANIDMVIGNSTDAATVARVRDLIDDGESVMVILDSDHHYAHVTDELEAYAPVVTPGSYLIACDGIMQEWTEDNPARAARDFVSRHPVFELSPPEHVATTFWQDGYLRRKA